MPASLSTAAREILPTFPCHRGHLTPHSNCREEPGAEGSREMCAVTTAAPAVWEPRVSLGGGSLDKTEETNPKES